MNELLEAAAKPGAGAATAGTVFSSGGAAAAAVSNAKYTFAKLVLVFMNRISSLRKKEAQNVCNYPQSIKGSMNIVWRAPKLVFRIETVTR